MLSGRAEYDADEWYVRIPDSGSRVAAVELVDSPISAWLARGSAALDPTRALAKLEVVRDGEVTAVALHICHALGDGAMIFAVLRDFWQIAAALDGKTPLPDLTPCYPRGIEDLYAERGVVLPRLDVRDPGPVSGLPTSVSPEGTGFRLAPGERITLSDRETDALLRYAHAEETTVHALLSAAIIRAERAMTPEPANVGATGTPQLPMLMFHPVDLRPHLRPPARPTDAANALGYAPTITACDPESDLLALSKEVRHQIRSSVDSGAALAVLLNFVSAPVASDEPVEFVRSFITNTGVVPALDIPSGVDFVDFRLFTTTDQNSPVPTVGFFVYTFQGRLNIEVEFSAQYNQPTQINELRRIVSENLELLIAVPPSRS
ncbi:phthiocerol/phthiodiolone dimycocerosyl transferase family protein [Nocardia transvalensis]|uniref:phthiocerol/phthiodiolone dimycocerosyl transferase family protein n=1 Tax=Nocardia transvalensis TaxID=37333 RepID=UPI001895F21B|nr:hypothetical protein [Nocardia transvalensis]MBF6331078.1 hypothetical protein [Nocardia transvalensis]